MFSSRFVSGQIWCLFSSVYSRNLSVISVCFTEAGAHYVISHWDDAIVLRITEGHCTVIIQFLLLRLKIKCLCTNYLYPHLHWKEKELSDTKKVTQLQCTPVGCKGRDCVIKFLVDAESIQTTIIFHTSLSCKCIFYGEKLFFSVVSAHLTTHNDIVTTNSLKSEAENICIFSISVALLTGQVEYPVILELHKCPLAVWRQKCEQVDADL